MCVFGTSVVILVILEKGNQSNMRNLDQSSPVKLIKVYSSFDNLEGKENCQKLEKNSCYKSDFKSPALLGQACVNYLLMRMFRLILFCCSGYV